MFLVTPIEGAAIGYTDGTEVEVERRSVPATRESPGGGERRTRLARFARPFDEATHEDRRQPAAGAGGGSHASAGQAAEHPHGRQ